MRAGYESSPCDACGEECVIRRCTTPACRMTPGCTGRHRPPMPQALRRTDIAPLHRNDDGPTARAAAATQTPRRLNETRQRILNALRTYGALTDHELADICDLHPGSASKRRGDCVKLGLIREAGRGVSPSGVAAAKWALTTEGITALDQLGRGHAS